MFALETVAIGVEDVGLCSLFIWVILRLKGRKGSKSRNGREGRKCGTDLSAVITWVGLGLSAAEPHALLFLCTWHLDLEKSSVRSREIQYKRLVATEITEIVSRIGMHKGVEDACAEWQCRCSR